MFFNSTFHTALYLCSVLVYYYQSFISPPVPMYLSIHWHNFLFLIPYLLLFQYIFLLSIYTYFYPFISLTICVISVQYFLELLLQYVAGEERHITFPSPHITLGETSQQGQHHITSGVPVRAIYWALSFENIVMFDASGKLDGEIFGGSFCLATFASPAMG